MQKNRKLFRIIPVFAILISLGFVFTILLAPLFEKTNKGGFLNERDNPDYILSSLAVVVLTTIFWGYTELKARRAEYVNRDQ